MGRRVQLGKEMAAAELGDSRRLERLCLLAQRLGDCPQKTIPGACRGWAETHAAYRLFNSPKVTHQAILDAHRSSAVQRASKCGDLLVLQDTTELDYSSHKALSGTGPLAEEGQRKGFFAHSRLMVAEEEAVVLGLEGSSIWAREEGRQGSGRSHKLVPIQEKESHRWLEGYHAGCALRDELGNKHRVTVVGDRESDIYELLAAQDAGGGADFLIRSCQDRALATGGNVGESIRGAPMLGSYRFKVRAARLTPKIKGKRCEVLRSAREAVMEVRACRVRLRPPHRPGGEKLPEVEVWVVGAFEKNPPEGEIPVEWVLLSSRPAHDFAAARRLVRAYSLRWLCEEFHRVLKTGCRVEDLAFQDADALLPAVALYMVVAWRILYLRDAARALPNHNCEDFFEAVEWRLAWLLVRGRRAPPENMSLREAIRLIGALGGHLGRKGDGEPGAEVLWRGFARLADAVFVQESLNP